LAAFTYFAYIFIITMYTAKIVKYLKLPVHLRWEIYPVVHEERSHYGGTYLEEGCGTNYKGGKWLLKALVYLSKDYLFLTSYFRWRISYWVALYLSHISSVCLIFFQGLLFVGALMEITLFPVTATSPHVTVQLVFYVTILAGLISFVTGIAGNAGLLVKRVLDYDLRGYTTPFMYGGYFFHIILSMSGLYAWYSVDGDFSQYRVFWEGLIQLSPAGVEPGLAVLIVLLGLHLIYLPFTRAVHYITRLFAFFLIRWDDKPNIRGCKLEQEIIRLQGQKVTWSAPHIKPGSRWSDLVG
jgi:nitrate reductase gamma subunit